MRSRGRPPLLPPGWIVFTLFALYPVFWLLGLAGFVWAMAALPLVIWLLLRRDIERPPTVTLFVLYVVWALFSVVRLDSATRVMTFGLRYGTYVTAACLAYYVYNERRVRRSTFIDWVSLLWVYAVVGGYIGLAFPRVRLTTPVGVLLPGRIANDEFVANFTEPRLAQVQNIFGVELPRPSTLFAFTNDWGANVGLLTPFFVAATIYSGDQVRRRIGIVGLALAIPPMLISVNRGLWISVGAIFAVVAVRSFLAGRTGPLRMLALGIATIAVLIVATPAGELVGGRLSETDANSRAGIYNEAWQGALDSPILGWGGPRPSINPFSPAVGTHGHVWFAMFSHGLIGLALFLAWIGWASYRGTLRSDPVSIMLASVVFVASLQMFFYNFFPSVLPIILIATGLMLRPDDRFGRAEPPERRIRLQPSEPVGAAP